KPDVIGTLEVSGPNVFAGYWRDPGKTAGEFTADGWFKSGDLGRIDRDGYVHIVGRAKDLVISGRGSILPREMELGLGRQAAVVAGRAGLIGRWREIMCDENLVEDVVSYRLRSGELSRRHFGALSLGVGLVSLLPRVAGAAGADVTESDVDIKTPDGPADAY